MFRLMLDRIKHISVGFTASSECRVVNWDLSGRENVSSLLYAGAIDVSVERIYILIQLMGISHRGKGCSRGMLSRKNFEYLDLRKPGNATLIRHF